MFLVGGLVPFAVNHPFIQRTFLHVSSTLPIRYYRARLVRLIDDDGLEDRHWQSELREVELFENERWVPGEGTGWSKTNLKTGERVAWTRRRDGWSAVTADGGGDVRSVVAFLGVWPTHTVTAAISRSCWNLVGYSLRRKTGGLTSRPNGAKLVRMTVSITQSSLVLQSCLFYSFITAGWVYTNDVWLEPHASPAADWKTQGSMTRRRRWLRRIYLDSAASPVP